ncbi:MAG: hypothetical protein A2X56_15315 [Nitrospirae bacterium GWC2_57_13]|jgi:DNA-binding beta-propeller fold protein YncE|nr:MAG: hypothetical protein A2072_07355 [Nitrospirae bacterium GWC1_57_7]OGW28086.1 MAG: hypothetical protein A2X56_15315 [Nitrospirae bacterium GWC2_57_13]OGW41477.1 MAG: hypothetical protein A2X57_06180 [Nitrospirae bacterium GWD2_57_8]HAR44959.1 hypothetical protein [Nitrospiraceae bacterium]HAS53772.1 hypothetical protein [Nitrospiraceae bacterium]
MKVLAILPFLAALFSGCAVITGEDSTLSREQAAGPRLAFEETLKSSESLQGQGLRENVRPAVFAQSLQRPVAVYADAFRVYVTDEYHLSSSQSARVFIFDRGDRSLTILGDGVPAADAVKLLAPSGIVVDAAGVVFVADAQQGRVFGYDRNGALLMEFGKRGELGSPAGLAIDRDRNLLYVADSHARLVKVFTTMGTPVLEIGAAGEHRLSGAAALSLDGAGNVYVLDDRSRKVRVYDREGAHLREFSIAGEQPGTSLQPRGIAVDSVGRVYVSDAVASSVRIFDASGAFIRTWGRSGVLAGEFLRPLGIFIDRNDTIYVVDQSNGRVQVFRSFP